MTRSKIILFAIAVLFLLATPFAVADDAAGVVGNPPVVGRAAIGSFVTLGFVDDTVQNLDGSMTIGIGLEGGRLTATCPPPTAAQCSAAVGKVSTFIGTVYTDGREVEAVVVVTVSD